MRTSDSITKISAAMVEVQRELTFATKGSFNTHLKNKYADLGSVIEACKGPLNDHGIAVIQLPTESVSGHIALITRLQHESGEYIESTAVVPLPKNDPQGYGSAMTYTRRYALAAAVGLYQDDDDGQKASKGKKTSAITPAGGVYDKLPEARKRACDAAAEAVAKHMHNGNSVAAMNQWEAEKLALSTDEQVGAWNLLDSKTRSTIKTLQKGRTNGQ